MTYRRTLFSHGFKVSSLSDQKKHLYFTYYVRAPQFRVIVFKGGGGRTWVYQKFLHMLEENGLIDNVKEYGGSSAGALFAVLAAMPLEHKERETIINNLKFHRDILDKSTASMIYRIITFPLYIISKPLGWIAYGFSYVAELCCKIKYGSLFSIPFSIISGIIKIAHVITHPHFLAGCYNLITKRGIYRGEELQKYICNALYRGTKKSIEHFINTIDDPDKKNWTINFLLKKMHNLISMVKINPKTQQAKVYLKTKDITFKHFHDLSAIKGLGFKEVFLTATRCNNSQKGRLKVFNYKKEPHKPIHLAIRMSMSAPFIYQSVRDRGVEYMDGGCANNFPIQHASKGHYANRCEARYLRGSHGQDLDVLGVRVEYEKDLGILHEPAQVITSKWEKFINNAQESIYNFLCGMDIYTPENISRQMIKEQYPLRVFQLYDHGVGFTEVDIATNRKDAILQCEEKRIKSFLKAHQSELTHVENYDSLSRAKLHDRNTMHLKRQKKFLHFLCNKKIPDEDIFSSEFSEERAAVCRKELIHALTVNLKGSRSRQARRTADNNAIRHNVSRLKL